MFAIAMATRFTNVGKLKKLRLKLEVYQPYWWVERRALVKAIEV